MHIGVNNNNSNVKWLLSTTFNLKTTTSMCRITWAPLIQTSMRQYSRALFAIDPRNQFINRGLSSMFLSFTLSSSKGAFLCSSNNDWLIMYCFYFCIQNVGVGGVFLKCVCVCVWVGVLIDLLPSSSSESTALDEPRFQRKLRNGLFERVRECRPIRNEPPLPAVNGNVDDNGVDRRWSESMMSIAAWARANEHIHSHRRPDGPEATWIACIWTDNNGCRFCFAFVLQILVHWFIDDIRVFVSGIDFILVVGGWKCG